MTENAAPLRRRLRDVVQRARTRGRRVPRPVHHAPLQRRRRRTSAPASNIQHPSSAIDADPLLPRPMSYYRIRTTQTGPEWGILYDVVGRGTAWLANRKPGDRVYAWGPLGHGYEIDRNAAQPAARRRRHRRRAARLARGRSLRARPQRHDDRRRARRVADLPGVDAAAAGRGRRHDRRRLGRAQGLRDGAVRRTATSGATRPSPAAPT